jgi:hypothetical protein
VGLSQTGTIANSMYVENNAVGESWVGGVVWANNVVQAFPSANTGNITVPFKHAFAYKANDVAVCVNGGSIAHDALADIPQNIEIARIGCAPWTPTANRWDGWIRNVKYYPTRLANSVMQSLTT